MIIIIIIMKQTFDRVTMPTISLEHRKLETHIIKLMKTFSKLLRFLYLLQSLNILHLDSAEDTGKNVLLSLLFSFVSKFFLPNLFFFKYLQVVVVRFVSESFTVDGKCDNLTFLVIDDNDALTRHCNVFRWIKSGGWFQRAKQITESRVNQHGTIWKYEKFYVSKKKKPGIFDVLRIGYLLTDPDTTNPNSAEITTTETGWSWPVRVARGVGNSPSPTIVWVLAFQCQSKTVQSAEPDAM